MAHRRPRTENRNARLLSPAGSTRVFGTPISGTPVSNTPVFGTSTQSTHPTDSRRKRAIRNSRGRGLRSPLIPQSLPAFNSRAQSFDASALEAFFEIDRHWHDKLTDLDIAVDDVPRILPKNNRVIHWPIEVTADGAVPLARLVPIGVDSSGNPTHARIVLFRRPIEHRTRDGIELLDLLHEILVQQIAAYLGVDEDVIDPQSNN